MPGKPHHHHPVNHIQRGKGRDPIQSPCQNEIGMHAHHRLHARHAKNPHYYRVQYKQNLCWRLPWHLLRRVRLREARSARRSRFAPGTKFPWGTRCVPRGALKAPCKARNSGHTEGQLRSSKRSSPHRMTEPGDVTLQPIPATT
jgi:hypothetical protein